jgi:hypothetical protein
LDRIVDVEGPFKNNGRAGIGLVYEFRSEVGKSI